MFVLLKFVAWLLLFIFGNILVEFFVHFSFMALFAYRWSIRSSIIYLLENGGGNSPDRNKYITGVDIITRLIWAYLFATVYIFSELAIIRNYIRADFSSKVAMVIGLVVAVSFFVFVADRIERNTIFRIGRLIGIDKTSKTAFFADLSYDNEGFTYCYSEEKEEYLHENTKYLVADYYPIFAMFVSMDI